jgi:IS30 family transposase
VIATLAERFSRFVMLTHLGRELNADTVKDNLTSTAIELPRVIRRTLTWDQGSEMAQHRAFSDATNTAVNFDRPRGALAARR